MTNEIQNKIAVASVIIALIALFGAIASWQRDSAMPWVRQWIEERGKRVDQLEQRLNDHEKLYHSGRNPRTK